MSNHTLDELIAMKGYDEVTVGYEYKEDFNSLESIKRFYVLIKKAGIKSTGETLQDAIDKIFVVLAAKNEQA